MINKPPRIYISAGEASGDMHAAGLAEELRKLHPDIVMTGMGGDKMRTAGVEIIEDYRDYSVMGFGGVIANLYRFKKLLDRTVKHIRGNDISLVIIVDYSGFNLRLAKAIHPLGIKVIYFISPQVWAWRTGRVNDIRKYTEKMITIFPFEKEFYKQHGVDVEYVGHPLVERIPLLNEHQRAEKKISLLHSRGIDNNSPTLGLFPGSRKQEVEKILPTMLRTASLLAKDITGLKTIIALSSNVNIDEFENTSSFRTVNPVIIKRNSSDVLFASDAALVTSGTTTVEAALHGTPQVVMYKTSLMTYAIARVMVRVKYIAMVNLIAERRAVPEFIQNDAHPGNLYNALLPLFTDGTAWQEARNNALKIRELLGEPGAYARAAGIVSSYFAMII
ncbi:MAG: lipid-A-disaccharide synthase [candidate division Zixibacteria bacterium]|nr:lipid-A-disaccharide synthase [candidate division Zixibacteria bacterium]